MQFFRMKAAKAFAFGVVMSGLAVACNEAGQVAKTIAPEAETANVSVGKGMQTSELTADDREAQKREFLAKPQVKEMSAGLEEIAEAVAVAVEDKSLRDRIYAKCMEKFDGETNVLWQQLESDGDVRSKGGWNKRIDDLVSKGRKNTIVKGVGNVDAAIKKFEKLVNAPLHLFWMYPSTWDKKATPLVAFVPWDVDPDTRQSIPAFDSKGNRFELDRKGELAKKRPILVVAVNERSEISGKTKVNVIAKSSNSSIEKNASKAEINLLNQTPKKGGRLTNQGQGFDMVRVQWVEFTDLAHDELPWDGGPEYEYRYYIALWNAQVGSDLLTRQGGTYFVGSTDQTSGTLRFTLGTPYNLHSVNSNNYYQGFYSQTLWFVYYEDDGLDGFDDHQGQHGFSAFTNTGLNTDLQFNLGTFGLGQWGKVLAAEYTFL